jgi:hypothetical protein
MGTLVRRRPIWLAVILRKFYQDKIFEVGRPFLLS